MTQDKASRSLETLLPETEHEVIERFKQAQSDLVIQSSDFSLRSLSEMVTESVIDLEPGYQRRDRWNVEKQSALIESFLLNVPVPPVYLAEEEYGQYSVIDGKQRIGAVSEFLSGKFRLKGLESLTQLNGLHFGDLPNELQNALSVRPYVRAVTLLRQSEPRLKYQVFLRLNTGGEKLNAQEIRNVAFRGPLNDLLLELSEAPFLRDRLKIAGTSSPNYRSMMDVEYVLRFLTLDSEWETFSGSLVRSMDEYMARRRSTSPSDLELLRERFMVALKRCEEIWGRNAFQRPAGNGWREQAIAGLYDAQMLSAVRLTAKQVAAVRSKSSKARLSALRKLFEDDSFDAAVRTATNTPQRVRLRVNRLLESLRSLAR